MSNNSDLTEEGLNVIYADPEQAAADRIDNLEKENERLRIENAKLIERVHKLSE